MVTVSMKNVVGLTNFVLILCNLKTTTQTETNSTHYKAGVVEFEPKDYSQPNWTSIEILQDNLKGYLQILSSTEANETDIIVFPEMTLNDNQEPTFVPDPTKVLQAPCDITINDDGEKYHDFLIELSCQAKNLSKYIVINIVEREKCLSPAADPRPCATSGLNLFNTNVVFDRKGVVISRYRKVHLWGEPRNTTFKPSLVYFDTDFGVRFGHFICFDLLFYTPAQAMVDKLGIKDFIFPTMWFSQMPFLTAVQIQTAWSYANDVNFLAAGASYPAVGNTGTGIYAGRRGPLKALMSRTEGKRSLLVASVKKHTPKRMKRDLVFNNILDTTRQQRVIDDIFLKQDDLDVYETLQVNLSDGNNTKKQICQYNLNTPTKFCCHFELEWTQVKRTETLQRPLYSYRLGVFNGYRKETLAETNILRNCALFACTGPAISECGMVFADVEPTNVTFSHLVIEAKFPNADELLIMPNSLKQDLLPVSVNNFNWTETFEGTSRKVRFELLRPVSNLLTFSIYGNYYDSHNAIDEPIICDKNGFDSQSQFCNDVAAMNFVSILLILLCTAVSNAVI